MTTYSLLFIDANEHIGRSRQIECATEQEALDMATHDPGNYKAVQVWKGDRPIAMILNPRSRGRLASVASSAGSVHHWSDGARTSS
jgi:hypothetical protein